MKELIQYDDDELMTKIKTDNMFAFDLLYKKYSKRLYLFAFSILKSAEESENIVQDVFLNIWVNRHRVEKNSSIKYYVFTIAYNSSISVLRKKASESKFLDYLKSLPHLDQEPVNLELEYKELANRLDEIVNSLPPRQKEVYQLHKVEELKYKEISKRLNISVNTVENHMSCALKTIREKLGHFSLLMELFWFLFVS